MLRVGQLRDLLHLSPDAFAERVGRFTLIQRPPEAVFANVGTQLSSAKTVWMAHRSRVGQRVIDMLRGFDHLEVIDMKPGPQSRDFVVGRLADCDVVVTDPSVSQKHARLRWNAETEICFVKDLGSLNGTFVNAREIHDTELFLVDGDTVAFGDVTFIFFRADTLYAQLSSQAPAKT